MKAKSDLLNGLTAVEYLNLLVKKTKQIYRLSQFNNISLCGIALQVHVYRGIHDLATAAGKEIDIIERPDSQYQTELSFNYKGIEFYELQK